jgi:hypothetical protein
MSKSASPPSPAVRTGTGGEPHQIAAAGQPVLTTNQGMMISDDTTACVPVRAGRCCAAWPRTAISS